MDVPPKLDRLWTELEALKKPAVTGFRVGGEEGTRTLDLFDANEALSQLSYSPKQAEYTSAPRTGQG